MDGGNVENGAKVVKPTSLADLAKTQMPVLEMPGWVEGQPISVRIKRISLVGMLSTGQLPNDLLGIVQKQVNGELKNPYKELANDDFLKFVSLMKEVARQSLIEPTYEQLVTTVGEFTDEMLLAIWAYSNFGLKALESFRLPSTSEADRGNS